MMFETVMGFIFAALLVYLAGVSYALWRISRFFQWASQHGITGLEDMGNER